MIAETIFCIYRAIYYICVDYCRKVCYNLHESCYEGMIEVHNILEKLKQLMHKANNSPVYVFFASLSSILGFIALLLKSNIVIQILCFVYFAALLSVFIVRWFSYTELNKMAKKSANESAVKIISSVIDSICNYNFEYRDCFEDIQQETDGSYSHLNNILRPLSDKLAELSKNIIGDESSICIKMIESESYMNSDFTKWKLVTIARSSSTRRIRANNDIGSVLVSENSDFYTIINPDDKNHSSQFIAPSIPRIIELWSAKGIPYNNSTKNFINYYKSTIVIPIRIKTKLVSAAIKNRMPILNSSHYSHYHIIGFLCWDSLNEYDDNDQKFKLLTAMLESCATCLYPLLENYLSLLINEQPVHSIIAGTNGAINP